MKNILILGGTGAMGTYLVEIMKKSIGGGKIFVTSRSSHISSDNVVYIKGNARDNVFLDNLLCKRFDAIVDFMNYNYDEMASRVIKLLSSTDHYIFFSSCRVYADSNMPLTEESPRLLETTKDMAFLSTNRYALRKARQEELIVHSGFHNYTIIRPYITYSDSRLQLGIYEKEQWLYRILKGRDLVINKNILYKRTSLTYGMDVAKVVSKCISNPSAMDKVIQIASSENKTWYEILKLYLSVIKEKQGITPQIYVCDKMKAIDEIYEGGYNTIYDRVYNRSFESKQAEKIIGMQIQYVGMREGLHACISNFLEKNQSFLKIDWKYEAYQDYLLEQHANTEEILTNGEREIYERCYDEASANAEMHERNLEQVIIQ